MHFPTAKSLLLGMAQTVELTEPRFKEVVVLYRTKADPPREDAWNKRPHLPLSAVKGSAVSNKHRNIQIKRFVDIPLGDTEMIMPDKVCNSCLLSLASKSALLDGVTYDRLASSGREDRLDSAFARCLDPE